jgi:GNAT superfamily N-acetyltransferase
MNLLAGGAGWWPGRAPVTPAARRVADAAVDAGGPTVLRDGRSVWLRAVRPSDAAASGRFFEALSMTARRRRFHGAVNALPAAALAAMTNPDPWRELVLVAEPLAADADDGGARLVGEARFAIDGGDPHVAEFALAVADEWQGHGLGRRLLERLVVEGRRRGLWRLHGDVLVDNAPMQALMNAVGADLRPRRGEAGLVRATLSLRPPV